MRNLLPTIRNAILGVGTKQADERRQRASFSKLVSQADQARDEQAWTIAMARYESALDLAPDRQDIWVQLGNVAKEARDFERSRQAYDTALRLAPNDSDAHVQLGHLLKLSGDKEGARQSYLRASQLDPSNSSALLELLNSPPALPQGEPAQPAGGQPTWGFAAGSEVGRQILSFAPNLCDMTASTFYDHAYRTFLKKTPPVGYKDPQTADGPDAMIAALEKIVRSEDLIQYYKGDYYLFLREFAAAIGQSSCTTYLAEYLYTTYSSMDSFQAYFGVVKDDLLRNTTASILIENRILPGSPPALTTLVHALCADTAARESRLAKLNETLGHLNWSLRDLRIHLPGKVLQPHDDRLDKIMRHVLILAHEYARAKQAHPINRTDAE